MLTRFVRQIGKVVVFQTGKGERQKTWAKLNFEIEVAGIDDNGQQSTHGAGDRTTELGEYCQGEAKEVVDESETRDVSATVTIDSKEHQGYAWATAEDIASGEYLMATPAQQELILEAFRAR